MSCPTRDGRAELNYVLSNSFGFGGINACIVLGRAATDLIQQIRPILSRFGFSALLPFRHAAISA